MSSCDQTDEHTAEAAHLGAVCIGHRNQSCARQDQQGVPFPEQIDDMTHGQFSNPPSFRQQPFPGPAHLPQSTQQAAEKMTNAPAVQVKV